MLLDFDEPLTEIWWFSLDWPPKEMRKSRLKPINSSEIVLFPSTNMAQNGILNAKLVFPNLHQVVCPSFLKFSTLVINCYLDSMPACILLGLCRIFLFLLVSFHNPALASSLFNAGAVSLFWAPWGLIRTHGPYMGHPTPHSCTDLSVYCYLLNSLLIATLLLPSYKPAQLFFFFLFIPPFSDLWITPILSHSFPFCSF